MAAPDFALRHSFGGGLATDLGSLADLDTDGGRVSIPFLLSADNAFFELSGSIRKIGGSSKYNSVTIESGQEIRGMFEYVRQGTAGSPSRKRVVHAGTKILADNNDGTFVEIKSGLEDDKVPNYVVFTDLLIMTTDSNTDVPIKWDQTTVANLGGTPPNFAFAVEHVNRLWAAGAAAAPSRLYYSAQLNAEDWTSADAGYIDIGPDDGDQITGLYSHRGVLFVFKGPNFGAIHVITGRTPSDFARDLFSSEVGAIGHNVIFPFGNDLGFMALDGSIRSLAATQKYGDFEESHLSRPITTWLRDHMSTTALRRSWARTDPTRGYVLFTVPTYGASAPNYTLCMDYRWSPPRFTTWPAFPAYSVARMSDPTGNNRPVLYLGGTDGFIRKTQQTTRLIDGLTYRFFVRTPYLHYNTQNRDKTIQHIGIGLTVHGTSDLSLTMRTAAGAETLTYESASGYTLGTGSVNPFVLGTATLAGTEYLTEWEEVDVGQFRQVSYELENLAGDADIDRLLVVFEPEQNPNYE